MIKLELTAILYSKKNYDMEYKLHLLCKRFCINLLTVLDFIELTIKSISLTPQIIFCDCSTINLSSFNIKAFMEKNEFKHTKVIFVGDKSQTNGLHNIVGGNLIAAEYCDISNIINSMQSELHFDSISSKLCNQTFQELDITIYKLLSNIGFSAKHSGYSYLRLAIKNVVANDGVIHSLNSDQYPYIASVFKTSVANIERDIRNAINHAWNIFGASGWSKIFFSKSMEMGKKPTNREFIFMCSEIIMSQIKYHIIPNY